LEELFVRVLGPLEVSTNGAVRPLEGKRQRTLLALLTVRAGSLVSREVLLEELWAGRPPATAAKSLQNGVVQLRRTLERDPRRPTVLVTEQGGYRLALDEDQLDALRFERLVTEGSELRARRRAEDAARELERALALWRGRAYADVGDEGIVGAEAVRLEELRLFALEERVEARLASGAHAELVSELRALISDHPLRERFRRQLMLALYRSGRQEEALDVYRAARFDLSERLGIEPSVELQELERAILNQDRALLGPAQTAPVVRLPVPPTELIGREPELSDLAQLVTEPGVRLVTVTGPGGIGKTRLVLELASRLAGRFQDGVFFIDLSPLQDSSLVLSEVARALGVPDRADEPLLDQVTSFLQARVALLVLDNLEHLLDARIDLSQLLRGLDGPRVLITSRVRLRLYGEHVYQVPALPVPALDQPTGAAELADVPAVALFVARSRAANHAFELTEDNAAVIAELCIRLDGIPLALELVAARSDAYSPGDLLGKMDRRLSFITGGPVDLPKRQQTLRAAIDWSYELLEPGDQETFATLSLFSGQFTEAAATAVCQTSRTNLDGLVDNSLVARVQRDATASLRMLETVREYAHRRLAERPDKEALQRRFVAYYAGLVEEAEPHLRGEGQTDWLDRLADEQDNLNAAFRLALVLEPGAALRMAVVLWRSWRIHGYLTQGREWLGEALERAQDAETTLRAKALNAAAALAMEQGDSDAAHRSQLSSLQGFEEAGDRAGVAMATNDLAIMVATEGDHEQAASLFQRAIELAAELGDRGRLATFQGNLGLLKLLDGDRAEATPLLESAAQELSACGDVYESLPVRQSLGLAYFLGGDIARARQTLLDQVREASAIGSRLDLLAGLEAIAAIAYSEGDVAVSVGLISFVDTRFDELHIDGPRPDSELCGELLRQARAAAADPRFTTMRGHGITMSFEQATDLALRGHVAS
jgi:predicted ATPase/DNA-binding SARP family transcriptional activator